jgi:hypothetical protein
MRAAALHCRRVAFICLNAAPALILFKKNSIIIIEKIKKKGVIIMKYIIDKERLRELLYDHYVLNCLYAAGIDNWDGFMINRTEYINNALGEYNLENFDLTEYEELIERR